MRLSKAIKVLSRRHAWLEKRIAERIANTGDPNGVVLHHDRCEKAALECLLAEVGVELASNDETADVADLIEAAS